MSKTTQENPAVEHSVAETVSNTSKARTRTRKTTDTASTSATPTTTTTRTRATSSPRKKAAPRTTKTESTTQTSVQQEKIMSQNTPRRVAIIGGNRIPFARSNGAYFTASNMDMFTAALNGLVERYNLQGQRLGEVVAGAVL